MEKVLFYSDPHFDWKAAETNLPYIIVSDERPESGIEHRYYGAPGGGATHAGSPDKCDHEMCRGIYAEYLIWAEKHAPKLILGDSGKPDFRALGKALGEALQEFSRYMAEFSKGMSEARQQEKAPDIGERVEQAGLDNELADYQDLLSQIAHAVRHDGPRTPAQRLATIGSLIEAFEAGEDI